MSIIATKNLKKSAVVSEEEVCEYDKALSRRLKELRDERGLKRGWVAKQLGVHYNTLKNWELGRAHPGTGDILALSKIYHVKPEEFFRGLKITS
ncbi:MAG: helix-turn-helix transcriptional regulator [Actinomycetota bacterium]|nr:helix-turn-helix transcriptional regulator [Actinomycetota bacterium]